MLERVRSTLFATKLHAAVTVVLALIVLVVAAFLLGFLGVPSVTGIENHFGGVNDTATVVETNVSVHNPNPIGIALGGLSIEYAIDMNGIEMARGSKSGLSIDRGNDTVALTTTLANERIPAWWVSHVDNGEVTTVAVDADVHSSLLGASFGAPTMERQIETDITSALNSTETRPVNANAPLASDPVVYVNETSGSWGSVTDAETDVEMTFTVYNPKPYAIPVSELGYEATMNDVDVGSGTTERSVVIPAGETRTIEATTTIDNDRLDDWWVTHVERNQVTNLTIAFHARIDLSTLGAGTVRIPLDSTSQTITTDIFGTKDEADTANPDGEDPTPTPGASTPAKGEDGTGTPTPTDPPVDDPLETPTPTPDDGTETPPGGSTETPTDDGGIIL